MSVLPGAGKGGNGGVGGMIYQQSSTTQVGNYNTGKTACPVHTAEMLVLVAWSKCMSWCKEFAYRYARCYSAFPCLQRAQHRKQMPMAVLAVLA